MRPLQLAQAGFEANGQVAAALFLNRLTTRDTARSSRLQLPTPHLDLYLQYNS
jgi:hypothetical protein